MIATPTGGGGGAGPATGTIGGVGGGGGAPSAPSPALSAGQFGGGEHVSMAADHGPSASPMPVQGGQGGLPVIPPSLPGAMFPVGDMKGNNDTPYDVLPGYGGTNQSWTDPTSKGATIL